MGVTPFAELPPEEQKRWTRDAHVVDGVGFLATDYEHPTRGIGASVCFMFSKGPHPATHPLLVDLDDTELDALPQLMRDVVKAVKKRRRALRADPTASVLAAPPATPPVHCPGCAARLFGAVAERGGCLACYPDLPPGEGVNLPDEPDPHDDTPEATA